MGSDAAFQISMNNNVCLAFAPAIVFTEYLVKLNAASITRQIVNLMGQSNDSAGRSCPERNAGSFVLEQKWKLLSRYELINAKTVSPASKIPREKLLQCV